MNTLNNAKDRLRLLGAWKDKLLSGPKTVYLDINTNCNINCLYCWIHSPLIKNHPKSQGLDLKIIKDIIDTSCKWDVEEIVISGDGEPTLHPQIDGIINYIKDRGFPLILSTNATLGTNLFKTICRVDHLYVNLSAAKNETYRELQCQNQDDMFDRVIGNLNLLSKMKSHRGKPAITVAYIINDKNYQEIVDMIHLGEKLGVDRITFRFMEPTIETKPILLSNYHSRKLKKSLKNISFDQIPIATNLDQIYIALNEYKKSIYNIPRCYTGWFNLLVDFNGNVSLCCHNENLIVGNIFKNSLKDIWNSQKAHNMRLKGKYSFNIKYKPWKGECEYCHWARFNRYIEDSVNNFSQGLFEKCYSNKMQIGKT